MRTAAALAVVLAAAALVVAAGVALAKPDRKGRVVRVERPRAGPATPLRVCLVRDPATASAACFGGRPAKGDVGAVLTEQGLLGRVELTSVNDHSDLCAGGSAAEVEYRWLGGPPSQQVVSSWNVLVLGLDGDPRHAQAIASPTSVPVPSGRSDDNVWHGIDSDGDSEPDVLVTFRDCTQSAPPHPSPGPDAHRVVYCIDHWVREDGAWSKLRGEHYYGCH